MSISRSHVSMILQRFNRHLDLNTHPWAVAIVRQIALSLTSASSEHSLDSDVLTSDMPSVKPDIDMVKYLKLYLCTFNEIRVTKDKKGKWKSWVDRFIQHHSAG